LKNQGIFPTDYDNSRSFDWIMIQRGKRIEWSFYDQNPIYFVCIACIHHTK